MELERAPESCGAEELRSRVRHGIEGESELLVAPEFFHALPGEISRIGGVSIQLKRGRRHNEMTRFRYDVVLKIGPGEAAPAMAEARGATLAEILQQLDSRPGSVVFRGIRNPRLAREVRALDLLKGDLLKGNLSAGELRRQVSAGVGIDPGVDPEDLWSLQVPYDVEIRWSEEALDRYDAVFLRRDAPRLLQQAAEIALAYKPLAHKPWCEFVNRRPAQASSAALIAELKRHMRERRPDYMSPSAYVMLDTLPRTPNGKVDWRALPAVTHSPQTAPAAPPRTGLERRIAEVWKRLLNLESVSVADNFFDLGANSLTMVQASSRLREELGRPLSLIDLFRYPSVSALAAHLEGTTEEAQDLDNSQARGRARLDFALRRVHARQVASEELGA